MRKLTKVQGFANKLEGFKVSTTEVMSTSAVMMKNGEYKIVVLQDAKKKIGVSISFKNKMIECDVIPAKNQADAIEIVEMLMEKHIQVEEDAQGYVVENGMSLADAMGIKADAIGVDAEQLVGKKIKYTAFYKDGRKNTTTVTVKRTELKMLNLSLRVELVCYNEKTGNTSFMKFSEKLNSDKINKWVFEVCEENTPPEEPTKFKPENTAIDTNQSHTAKMVVENMLDGDKVLDYGCGTGRNMRYIKNNADVKNIVVEGCDIADQLVRNAHKHEELKKNGMDVFEDVNTPKEKYNIVLNSHVLNVIPSDEIKQLVINNIYDALVDGGHALIEVRTKSDVEGAKYKVPFGDGWHMTKTNTYQESLTKEKMQMLALNAGFIIEEHVFSKSTRHYMIVQKNTRKVAVA